MPEVDAALDNDILLKAACYGLTDRIWPRPFRLGVLGTARFVLPRRIKGRVRSQAAAEAEFWALSERASELEPNDEEERIALDLEVAAQEAGLPLDAGESQLAAIAIVRSIEHLDTGDKRAVGALERLVDVVARLPELEQRIRSLEQLVHWALRTPQNCRDIGAAICAEPAVDRTLSICFGCFGPGSTCDGAREGLRSYIEDLRREAPRLLARG